MKVYHDGDTTTIKEFLVILETSRQELELIQNRWLARVRDDWPSIIYATRKGNTILDIKVIVDSVPADTIGTMLGFRIIR